MACGQQRASLNTPLVLPDGTGVMWLFCEDEMRLGTVFQCVLPELEAAYQRAEQARTIIALAGDQDAQFPSGELARNAFVHEYDIPCLTGCCPAGSALLRFDFTNPVAPLQTGRSQVRRLVRIVLVPAGPQAVVAVPRQLHQVVVSKPTVPSIWSVATVPLFDGMDDLENPASSGSSVSTFPFESALDQAVETAYQAYVSSNYNPEFELFTYEAGSTYDRQNYRLYFSNMKQMNVHYGTIRPVFRNASVADSRATGSSAASSNGAAADVDTLSHMMASSNIQVERNEFAAMSASTGGICVPIGKIRAKNNDAMGDSVAVAIKSEPAASAPACSTM